MRVPANATPGLNDPGSFHANVTPDDNRDLDESCRSFYVGTGGDIACVSTGGTTAIYRNVTGCFVVPMRIKRILATGTTAADIVAMW